MSGDHGVAVCITLTQSTVPQVQYAALHNFEDREEDFRADVVTLRRRFTSDGMQTCTPRPAAVLQPLAPDFALVQ